MAEPRSLIIAQGSVQLLAALCVAQTHNPQFYRRGQRHLVVVGLFSDDDENFSQQIAGMARAAGRWHSIQFLSDAELVRWGGALKNYPQSWVLSRLRRRLGLLQVEEIFVSRNWLFGNELLLAAYPHSQKIGYGDGLGFYFTRDYGTAPGEPDYFSQTANTQSVGKGLVQLKRKVMQGLGVRKELPRQPLDLHYLAFPDVFGCRPETHVTRVPMSRIVDEAKRIASAIELPRPARNVAFLLPSNLSEARRIDVQNEINAVADFVCEQPSVAKWLLKPHPRDDRQKTLALTRALRQRGCAVELWDEALQKFWPLEIILAQPGIDVRNQSCIAFGTVALGLKAMFGMSVQLGFGETILGRYFSPDQSCWRGRYESDLQTALRELSTSSSISSDSWCPEGSQNAER